MIDTLTMHQAIIVGAIQGIAEWLPISSEGMIVLYLNSLGSNETIDTLLRFAAWLHMGTLLSAVVYLFGDIKQMIHRVSIRNLMHDSFIRFYGITTIISVLIAGGLYVAITKLGEDYFQGVILSGLVAIALLITGVVQLVKKQGVMFKNEESGTWSDMVIVGIGQGLAVIPGISRSGITSALLLLRSFDPQQALKISFLLSIPLVLVGNIALNTSHFFNPTPTLVIACVSSFVFGLLSIDILIKVARRINFGWFVIFLSLFVGADVVFGVL